MPKPKPATLYWPFTNIVMDVHAPDFNPRNPPPGVLEQQAQQKGATMPKDKKNKKKAEEIPAEEPKKASPPTPTDITVTIVGNLKKYRAERKMSTEELATACTKNGFPYQATQLRTIEGLRRKSVTVDELLAFAQALDVKPMRLLKP